MTTNTIPLKVNNSGFFLILEAHSKAANAADECK